MERNRRERQRNEFGGSHGFRRNTEHSDLVVSCLWTVFAIGLVTMFVRGDWQKARGLDKLILFGPLFYAAPIAAFGTEHFTLTKIIASIVPRLFRGICFGHTSLARVLSQLGSAW